MLKNQQKDKARLVREHDEPNESHRIKRDHEVYRQDNRPIISNLTPVLQTAFTDWFHVPFDYQHDKICGRIEKNFYKCIEAYGSNRGFKQCRDYIDDYRECTSFDKQKKRIEIITKERSRQLKTGETKAYSKPPRMGSYESTIY